MKMRSDHGEKRGREGREGRLLLPPSRGKGEARAAWPRSFPFASETAPRFAGNKEKEGRRTSRRKGSLQAVKTTPERGNQTCSRRGKGNFLSNFGKKNSLREAGRRSAGDKL